MSKLICLRDKKKARIKLKILEITLELLKNKDFNEVFVEEICEQAEISKVTFYKYFPQKEDILVYFMRVWCFQRSIELKYSPKIGLAAIYNLFEKATSFPDSQVMISLISFIVKLKKKPDLLEIDTVEKMLLYPEENNIAELSVISLEEMFLKHLKEAVKNGELTAITDFHPIIIVLGSIFYGMPVINHIHQESDLRSNYLIHLGLIFQALGMKNLNFEVFKP